MQTVHPYLAPLGRLLLGVIFLLAGLEKIGNLEGTAQYMASAGFPLVPLFLIGAVIVEVIGSLALIVGYQTRWAALALALFSIAAALIFHHFWDLEGGQRAMQQINFMKNLAIAGGMLMVVHFGAGPISVDARRGKTA
ncbi:MAG TPA: DoxX family protein [Alphaproteobacteria bacterium]|nr:DoxX family protein [Alphaproteobacteria bacterium]